MPHLGHCVWAHFPSLLWALPISMLRFVSILKHTCLFSAVASQKSLLFFYPFALTCHPDSFIHQLLRPCVQTAPCPLVIWGRILSDNLIYVSHLSHLCQNWKWSLSTVQIHFSALAALSRGWCLDVKPLPVARTPPATMPTAASISSVAHPLLLSLSADTQWSQGFSPQCFWYRVRLLKTDSSCSRFTTSVGSAVPCCVIKPVAQTRGEVRQGEI